MAHAACKWILNQGVASTASATNEILKAQLAEGVEVFDEAAIDSMIDLDLAYQSAKHLIQNGDEKTRWLVAKFNADVTARAMMRAADRVGDLESES